MPSIRRDEKQELALKAIESDIKAIPAIDDVLGTEDVGTYSVVVQYGKGRGKKFTIPLDKLDAEKRVVPILRAQRTALVKAVRDNCKNYRIDLDEEEERIIGNTPEQKKGNQGTSAPEDDQPLPVDDTLDDGIEDFEDLDSISEETSESSY